MVPSRDSDEEVVVVVMPKAVVITIRLLSITFIFSITTFVIVLKYDDFLLFPLQFTSNFNKILMIIAYYFKQLLLTFSIHLKYRILNKLNQLTSFINE